MPTAAELTGRTFGRWTVLERSPKKQRRVPWLCRCECGTVRLVATDNLLAGRSRSCGCLKNDVCRARLSNPATHPALKHGHARNWTSIESPEYRAWTAAKQRCFNAKHESYKDYGGRGITMCAEWCASFEAFFRDVGLRPSPQHSLDRIDNESHYAPGNCRWATPKEQASHRRPMRPRAARG